MRWPAFFILAYVVLGLQLGLSGFINIHHAEPNLILLVAIFVASNAPRNSAILACIILGAMHDLLVRAPWGCHAFAYGLVGIFITSTQEFVYGEHFLTYFFRSLVGSVIVAVTLLFHGWVYTSIHHQTNWTSDGTVVLLAGSFYTAILSIPIMLVLQKLRRSFGFRPLRGRI